MVDKKECFLCRAVDAGKLARHHDVDERGHRWIVCDRCGGYYIDENPLTRWPLTLEQGILASAIARRGSDAERHARFHHPIEPLLAEERPPSDGALSDGLFSEITRLCKYPAVPAERCSLLAIAARSYMPTHAAEVLARGFERDGLLRLDGSRDGLIVELTELGWRRRLELSRGP